MRKVSIILKRIKYRKSAEMSFFPEIYDFLDEYRIKLGFAIYVPLASFSVTIIYISFNMLGYGTYFIWFVSIAVIIELILFYLFPYRFYKNYYGFGVILEDPHRYDDEKRLNSLKVNRGNNVLFSFTLKFGKKLLLSLNEKNDYKIIFHKSKYLKIDPKDKINSLDKWDDDYGNNAIYTGFYDMDYTLTLTFQLSTNSSLNLSKILKIYFEHDGKKTKLHEETLEINS
jgi:hypothetical protein